MEYELPTTGAASIQVQRLVHEVWLDEAAKAGIDLTGFDPQAPLTDRLNWAAAIGLLVAAILSRFSTKLQQSTEAQVRDCAIFAARNKMYVPPELVCVDENVSGRKVHRHGLDRMRLILKQKSAGVLLVFKVSRIFRVAYRGFQFFQEEVVEEGLRAISITQGIDTADTKSWKPLAYLHGVMDELLLSTIADHVRSGLKNLFEKGFVTGALTVGYSDNLAALQARRKTLTAKIEDLDELLGEGSDSDRVELKGKIRIARSERTSIDAELARLNGATRRSSQPITPGDVRAILDDFHGLLERAVAGQLGPDAIYKAVSVFRRLTGGRIVVHFDPRPGRKRTGARGVFIPHLLAAIAAAVEGPVPQEGGAAAPVEVCLRRPPRMDRYAAEVRRRYEDEKLGFRAIGSLLGIGCAGAWQAYRRFYEMRGEPMPPRRYNSGRKRKAG